MDNPNIKSYIELEKKQEEISHLDNILKIIKWDFTTYIPKLSAQSRKKEISTLTAIIHKLKSSNEIKYLIKSSQEESLYLDEWQKRNLFLIKKQYDETKIIPIELEQEYSKISSECEYLWRDCRKHNDYKTISPYLDRVFSLISEISKIKSEYYKVSKYDSLVDQFDPERKLHEIKKVFKDTKEKLPSLMDAIIKKQSNEKVIPLKEAISVDTQRKVEYRIMEIMGFDFKKGRLDESAHPFCSGTADDTRITTTHFKENFLISAYSVVHELGHGLYQQNLPIKYKNQPVGNFLGYAFHESQSLIMEKQIGTSYEFLDFFSKLLKDEFGITGKEYSAENLFNLKTRVTPSFIRIDADEVTYPMHVILRSEIEEKIINRELSAKELPDVWNNKMYQYLGITPNKYSDGCLQDIHWPSGLFGYFPCYYVGTILASMQMHNLISLGQIDIESIRKGNFSKINSYLNKNIRHYGSKYKSQTLLEKSTGRTELNVDIFLSYIKNKYL
jgi:carboxypeptidase Taq